MNNVFISALMSLCILLTVSCTSSGPATSYYSLFASKSIERVHLNSSEISIGVGPILLPEYLENPAVVSLSRSQIVRVSGYHAWAGDLKDAMSRVIAQEVSTALSADKVWAFPWDNRVRPQYQIRIVFEEFSGIRGGQVSLRAKWSLLNQRGDTVLLFATEQFSSNTSSESVDTYVAELNQLLNQFSLRVAEESADYLNKN